MTQSEPRKPKYDRSEEDNSAKKEEPENLAGQIKKISASMEKLLKSGLNRKAVVVLLSHDAKLSASTINTVLDSLESLAVKYTTKEKRNG